MTTKRRVLVIDDIREFKGAEHAKTSYGGLFMLERGVWDEIALDHDLGGNDTIDPVVDYLVDMGKSLKRRGLRPPSIWVITMNPVGALKIKAALSGLYPMTFDPGGYDLRWTFDVQKRLRPTELEADTQEAKGDTV